VPYVAADVPLMERMAKAARRTSLVKPVWAILERSPPRRVTRRRSPSRATTSEFGPLRARPPSRCEPLETSIRKAGVFSGEVVRWIGPEDSETPAPIVTITAPAEEAAAADNDRDTFTLVIALAALVVGIGGLALRLLGFVRRPRAA
jgi:hypothetical protein